MARLLSIQCARCGNRVEFYEGQGMFKCGNCGALYESVGEGVSGVKMVNAPEEQQFSTAGAASGYQPGAPGYGSQQAGWEKGYYVAPQQPTYQYGLPGGMPQIGVYPKRGGYGGGKGVDFLKFRLFITPVFVQILFWIEVVLFLAAGIAIMSISFDYGGPSDWQIVTGVFLILLGPVFARVWCERLAVQFRSYEELKSINAKVGEAGSMWSSTEAKK